MTTDDGAPRDGEIVPPQEKLRNPEHSGDNYVALISQYTERPDLLIDALEKHDPGFVARMNEKTEERSERLGEQRFRFGKYQAYTALFVSVVLAFGILVIVGVSVVQGSAGFGTILALAAFYAVSQGGPSGFIKIIQGISDALQKRSGGNSEE